MLELDGVTKRFHVGGTTVTAVEEVSLRARSGEILLIMGPSGSGKTTLLTMIGALLRPDTGRILIEEIELGRLSPRQIARFRLERLGFIFQDFNLITALPAVDNVALPLMLAGVSRARALGRAGEILDRVGLGERLHFQPTRLSGGEKQRVAIARALINGPRLILADEPTANLDSRTGREVAELIRVSVKEGDSLAVIVSHDWRLRHLADRIVEMEDGRIRERSA